MSTDFIFYSQCLNYFIASKVIKISRENVLLWANYLGYQEKIIFESHHHLCIWYVDLQNPPPRFATCKWLITCKPLVASHILTRDDSHEKQKMTVHGTIWKVIYIIPSYCAKVNAYITIKCWLEVSEVSTICIRLFPRCGHLWKCKANFSLEVWSFFFSMFSSFHYRYRSEFAMCFRKKKDHTSGNNGDKEICLTFS